MSLEAVTRTIFLSDAYLVYDYGTMIHVYETTYPNRDRWFEGDQTCAKLRANIAHLLKSSNDDVEKFLLTELAQE